MPRGGGKTAPERKTKIMIDDVFEQVYALMKELPLPVFISMLMVLMEQKCKDCDVDIVEFAELIPDLVKSVNEEQGRL